MITTLKMLIRTGRKNKGWSQEKLAEEAGLSMKWVSLVEREKGAPSLSAVVRVYESLDSPAPPSTWLQAWALQATKALTEGQDDQDLNQSIQKFHGEAEQEIHQLFGETTSPEVALNNNPRTIIDVLRSDKLIVISGDRRESKPKTPGDLFAASNSVLDLMYLPTLGLPRDTKILSDKSLIMMNEQDLSRRFGNCNILVLGSAHVNIATRVLNRHSVFRLAFNDTAISLLDSYLCANFPDAEDELHVLANIINGDPVGRTEVQESRLKNLKNIAETVLAGFTIEEWLERLKPQCLEGPRFPKSDSAELEKPTKATDRAFVSICPNIWEPRSSKPKFFCVLAVGVHGPGTALAVKSLGEPEKFEQHPYGGILEVELSVQKEPWPTRVEQATWKWVTPNYSTDDIIHALEAMRKERESRDHNSRDIKQIQQCLAVIRRLAGSSG